MNRSLVMMLFELHLYLLNHFVIRSEDLWIIPYWMIVVLECFYKIQTVAVVFVVLEMEYLPSSIAKEVICKWNGYDVCDRI